MQGVCNHAALSLRLPKHFPPQIGKLFNKCASAVSSNKQAVYKYANADFSNALVVPRMYRRRFANWQRHGRIFYLLRLKIFLMQWNIEH